MGTEWGSGAPGAERAPIDERNGGRSYDLGPHRRGGSWVQRRRDKAMAEIDRNRRGEYSVPTWVLVVVLVAMVGAWVSIIAFN